MDGVTRFSTLFLKKKKLYLAKNGFAKFFVFAKILDLVFYDL